MTTPVNSNVNNHHTGPINSYPVTPSYIGMVAYSVAVLLQTIPHALHSISCLAWTISRTGINTTTAITFGVTVLNVEKFSSQSVASSKKAILCIFAGTLAPIIGLASTKLGYRLLNLPKNVIPSLSGATSKSTNADTKPSQPTRINMLSKTVLSLVAIPVQLVEATSNIFWTATRTTVNIFTFVTVGNGILNVNETATKSAKLITQATLAILTCPATLVINVGSPEVSEKFYKRFGPGCIEIKEREQTESKNSSSASSKNDFTSSSSTSSSNDTDSSSSKTEESSNSNEQSTEKSDVPPAPPMNEPIPDAPPMDNPVPNAPPMDPPPPPPMDDIFGSGSKKPAFGSGSKKGSPAKKPEEERAPIKVDLGDAIKNFKKTTLRRTVSTSEIKKDLIKGVQGFKTSTLKKVEQNPKVNSSPSFITVEDPVLMARLATIRAAWNKKEEEES